MRFCSNFRFFWLEPESDSKRRTTPNELVRCARDWSIDFSPPSVCPSRSCSCRRTIDCRPLWPPSNRVAVVRVTVARASRVETWRHREISAKRALDDSVRSCFDVRTRSTCSPFRTTRTRFWKDTWPNSISEDAPVWALSFATVWKAIRFESISIQVPTARLAFKIIIVTNALSIHTMYKQGNVILFKRVKISSKRTAFL